MKALLISSSNVHGFGYLDHPEPEMKRVLEGVKRVAFVPFAIQDREAYHAKVAERLGRMGFDVDQVRTAADIERAEAIFVGGGNTFRLLKALHELDLIEPIRQLVRRGAPYLGSSAGSNIAAPTIRTTNDMPIVEPPSLAALALVPFQINPHYLDPEPDSQHKGETREQRLLEYLEENERPVVAIREGTALRCDGERVVLVGDRNARIYRRGAEPLEVPPGTVITDVLR